MTPMFLQVSLMVKASGQNSFRIRTLYRGYMPH